MSKIKRQELTQVLEQASAFRISDETRKAHLDAIGRAVAAAPIPPATAPTKSLRRRITALAIAAATLAGPTAVAMAAQGSLPNSTLYPVKRLTERVETLFDPSIPAEHRVDELSELIDRLAPRDQIDEALTAAESAVEASESSELSATLDDLRTKVADERDSETGDDTTETTIPAATDDSQSVTTTEASFDDDSSVAPSTTEPSNDTHETSGDDGDSSDSHSDEHEEG